MEQVFNFDFFRDDLRIDKGFKEGINPFTARLRAEASRHLELSSSGWSLTPGFLGGAIATGNQFTDCSCRTAR